MSDRMSKVLIYIVEYINWYVFQNPFLKSIEIIKLLVVSK